MLNKLWLRFAPLVVLALCFGATAQTPLPTRAQALKALDQPSAQARRVAVQRLGDVGTMPDADKLVARLRDDDAQVRELAAASLWQIWSRSGDKAIDAQYQRGVQQMERGQLRESIQTFSDIIRRKPAFAEAWNKRATAYYVVGDLERSLKDCAEVMKRNPNHFGALSGYGQIYLQMGALEQSIHFFEQALQVNPNLDGATSIVEQIRKHLDEKQRNTI